MDNLYAYSLLLVIFVGLSIVLATSEIGWQLGVRADGRGGNNISALEQSLLGLLALMIGFTFLMYPEGISIVRSQSGSGLEAASRRVT